MDDEQPLLAGWMCGLRTARLVAGPVSHLIPSELVQVPPGEQTGVVSVIEHDFDGILSDGLDGTDTDIFLAEHQDLLSRAMSFDFRGGRVHTQVLERQLKPAAVRKTHLEQAGFAADFDFSRHGVSHISASIGPGL